MDTVSELTFEDAESRATSLNEEVLEFTPNDEEPANQRGEPVQPEAPDDF